MAAGSVTVAALRHRPRQAALVVLLSAVVTGVAVLGPLYSRAVEQSVLRTAVGAAPVAQSGIVVFAMGSPPPSPAKLAKVVAPAVPRQFDPAVRGADTIVRVQLDLGPIVSSQSPSHLGRLTSRAGACGHLQVTAGRCMADDGEVMLSVGSAESTGIEVGSVLRIVPDGSGPPDPDGSGAPDPDAVSLRATVVGIYQPVDRGDPFWAGRGQSGNQPLRPSVSATAETTAATVLDDVLTTWSTLASRPWPQLRTSLDIPVVADRVDLAGTAALTRATEDVDRLARTVGGSASSRLEPLLASTDSQREQVRQVVPLLAVQLAVLGLVVLAFVCAATMEQRRPEIALARLRGLRPATAAALLVRDLAVLVLIGTMIGAVLGWLTARAATALWLEPGVVLEAQRWPVALAVAAAAAAALLAIVAACSPTLRQPITSLLRRVPPRSSALQIGLVEGAVVAAAGAGLVTLLSGDGGPVALLAPGLLAVAGGLLLSQVTVPAAGPLARVALRRGRLPWALASLQIARRPALRRLIAIVTVACALLVFAVDTWSVASRNRTTRAEVEAGAPVVLTVDADSSFELREAVLEIDGDGRFATPVVTISSAAEAGPRTTAVEPVAFARIARWGRDTARPAGRDLAQLAPPRPPPVMLTGSSLEVRARFSVRGIREVRGGLEPELRPFQIALDLEGTDGFVQQVALGVARAGVRKYLAPMACRQGCLLRRVKVTRTFGDFAEAQVRLDILGLAAGSGEVRDAVDLDAGQEGSWQAVPSPGSATSDAVVVAGDAITISGRSFGPPLAAQRGDRPAFVTAITAGRLALPTTFTGVRSAAQVLSPDLSGSEVVYELVGRVPQVPRSGTRGVLVDLAAVLAGPSAAAAAGRTTYDIWLAEDDPEREADLRRELADRGLHVIGRDTTGAHIDAFEAEGPVLALRLALLAGLAALVLAALVLVVGVATSGSGRARDLAGLRLVGVPADIVRRASVREHLVVAVLGVAAGGVLGVVAAHAALPDIPLSATPADRMPLVLGPAWPAVLVTVLACLALLSLVSVAVGRRLAAAATPERLREGS